MKQVEVLILGQSYRLACPDDGETLLHRAVARVDQEMSAIRDAGKVKARERMAVLAALNLAYQLADRAPAAASFAAAAVSNAGAGGAVSAVPPEAAQAPTIAQLVRRIDAILADDDRLI